MITKKITATLIAVVALYAFSSAATATLITFEETDIGNATAPGDNTAVGTFTDGTITVDFGVDTSPGDGLITDQASFESRGDTAATNEAYNGGISGSDGDVGATGGSWLARPPLAGDIGYAGADFDLYVDGVFVVDYGGALPDTVSGEIWDVDDAELLSIEAFDTSDVSIFSTTTAFLAGGGDAAPMSFSITPADLGVGVVIDYLQIAGISHTNALGRVGFDNFNQSAPVVDDDDDDDDDGPNATPEPSTFALTILGLLSLGAFARRRHKRA